MNNNTFNGSHGVINNVPSNEQCKLLVTDGDAASFINARAAVTIEGITVPSITTAYAETESTQSTPTAGLAHNYNFFSFFTVKFPFFPRIHYKQPKNIHYWCSNCSWDCSSNW